METTLKDSKSTLKWIIENKINCDKAHILHQSPNYIISCEESVRFLPIPSKRKRFYNEYQYNSDNGSINKSSSVMSHEIPCDLIGRYLSPSGKLEFQIKFNNESGKYNECIEIWQNGLPIQIKNVNGNMKQIYKDPFFGNVCWSQDENYVVFIGEKNPNSVPYLWDEKNGTIQNMEAMCKNEYIEDFGEQMKDKKNPCLFVYSVLENSIKEIQFTINPEVFPSCPIFDNENGIIFAGIYKKSNPKGIVGFIKESSLFYIKDFNNPNIIQKISKDEFVCLSPHFSHDFKKLAYFSIPTPVLTHSSCFDLRTINWPFTKENMPEIIIPVIEQPKEKHGFPGIFGYQSTWVNNYCRFIGNNGNFIFNSFAYGNLKVFIVNINTKELREITELPQDNNAILTIYDNLALIRSSAINVMPYYSLLKLYDSKEKLSSLKIEILAFGQYFNKLCPEITSKLGNIEKRVIEYGPAEGYLYANFEEKAKRQPLIVLLHGGPHSNFAEIYFNYVSMFFVQGYSALIINYRASIGYGKAMLEAYLGKISENDVEDVYQITSKAINTYKSIIDDRNIFFVGYSFGGFLTSWILAKYPKFVNAALVKNPAVNLIDTLHSVDIPDWAYGEALKAKPNLIPTEGQLCKFYEKSPLYHADKITTPLFIMVGEKDGRIPCFSGIQLHKILRSKEIPTRLFSFPEDTHGLNSPEADEIGALNALAWFETFKQ